MHFKEKDDFIEMPNGIFTARGEWFHITKDSIENNIPGFFDEFSLSEIVKKAHVWVDSSRQITTIVTMVLAFFIDAWLALGLGLLFYFFWEKNKSAFTGKWSTKLMWLFTREVIPVLLAVAAISNLGNQELYFRMAALFVFFLGLRFGLLKKLSRKLFEKEDSKSLSLNDRLILMLTTKLAIAEKLTVPGIRGMEEQVFSIVTRQKKKGKKKRENAG
jgi:hypothetical protein